MTRRKLYFNIKAASEKEKNHQFDDCNHEKEDRNKVNNIKKLKIIDPSLMLLNAVKSGNFKSVKYWVENDANIEIRNKWGATALYIAVLKKYLNIADFLIKNGAEVDALTGLQATPLNLAIGYIDLRIAKLLLESGADVERKTIMGDSLMHEAARYQNLELIELLIKYNADIEAVSYEGLTPLGIAVKSMSINVIKILLYYGANITQHDIFNAIVIHATHDEEAIARLLILAKKVDSVLVEPSQDEKQDLPFITKSENLHQINSKIFYHRLINKFLKNKSVTVEELNNILQESIYKIGNFNSDLKLTWITKLQDFLDSFSQDLAIASIENEIGKVSSLFILSGNALKKAGLWDLKQIEKISPDIFDKMQAKINALNLLNSLNIHLNQKKVDVPMHNNFEYDDVESNNSDKAEDISLIGHDVSI